MIHAEPMSSDSYQKQREAMKRRLNMADKDSDSKILEAANKEEQRDKPAINENCELTHRLVSEGLEMYREGDMEFDEFVEDLHKSLIALAKTTPSNKAKKEKDDEED